MFIWIQVLRGLAAAMVVCHHYVAAQAEQGVNAGRWLMEFGGSGVDIFFVISGFIMTITQSGEPRLCTARRFLLRRMLRIAPLYWGLTAAAFGLAVVAADSVHADFSTEKFLMSMLFLPCCDGSIDMAAQGYQAYVIPMAWTLTYEWLFYLVFALALALRLGPVARLGFIASCFAAGVLAGMLLRPSMPLLQVLSNPLLFEFLLGCAVAVLYQQGFRLQAWQALPLALAAMPVLANLGHDSAASRILLWGAAAFALVAAAALTSGARAKPGLLLRPFARLGDISYSLYLSHFFTLALFVRLQQHLPPLLDGYGVLAILLFALLAWQVAALCYRFLEQPPREFLARIGAIMELARR